MDVEQRIAAGRDIVVIGGSAGVAEVLKEVLRRLPASFPAAIFIVYHVPPGANGGFQGFLAGVANMEVKLADDGESVRKGTVYVARPDRHLLLEKGRVRVTRGPRENRWRPAIDPLFRSAAVHYGSRVIGVVLSGMLDDGTAGLRAIKRCGGVTVVQDPHDAAYPEMAQHALDNVAVDHRVAVSRMGEVLQRLAREPAGPNPVVPRELLEEARVSAQGVPRDEIPPAEAADYICPECGGPLHRENGPEEQAPRYRCLVGHGWGETTLLSSTNDQLESTIWASIRLFRQRAQLLSSYAKREHRLGRKGSARTYHELVRESLGHAERLQQLAMGKLHLDEGAAATETIAETGGRAASR